MHAGKGIGEAHRELNQREAWGIRAWASWRSVWSSSEIFWCRRWRKGGNQGVVGPLCGFVHNEFVMVGRYVERVVNDW